MDIKLEELTVNDIQMAINIDARRLNHKSVKNAYGFLRVVLNANDINIIMIAVTFSQAQQQC